MENEVKDDANIALREEKPEKEEKEIKSKHVKEGDTFRFDVC